MAARNVDFPLIKDKIVSSFRRDDTVFMGWKGRHGRDAKPRPTPLPSPGLEMLPRLAAVETSPVAPERRVSKSVLVPDEGVPRALESADATSPWTLALLGRPPSEVCVCGFALRGPFVYAPAHFSGNALLWGGRWEDECPRPL